MCAKNTETKIAGQRGTDIIEGTAVSASLLCLVHCLALPLLLLLLPGIIGVFARSEAFHYIALALIVPSAGAAFWLGYQRHRTPGPVLLGVAGVACLAIALLPILSEGAEIWMTVAGSLFLVTGHMLNWRRRTCAA